MSNSLITPDWFLDEGAALGLSGAAGRRRSAPPAAPPGIREQILGAGASKQPALRVSPLDFRQLLTVALRERQVAADPEHVEVNDERPAGPLWCGVRLTGSFRSRPNGNAVASGAGPSPNGGEGAQYLLLAALEQKDGEARFNVSLTRLATLETLAAGRATLDESEPDYDSVIRGVRRALLRFDSVWAV